MTLTVDNLAPFVESILHSMEGATGDIQYKASFAGGSSGLSFGQSQNDVRTQGVLLETGLSAQGVLRVALSNYGVEQSKINSILTAAGTAGITKNTFNTLIPGGTDLVEAALKNSATLVHAQDASAVNVVV